METVIHAVESYAGGIGDDALAQIVESQLSTVFSPEQMSDVASLVRELEEEIAAVGPGTRKLLDVIEPYLPALIYFDDTIEFIDDSIAYEEAASDPNKFRTMINLAKLANIDLLQMSRMSGHERLLAGNRGQVTISQEISKYWHESVVTFFIQLDKDEMILTVEHRGRTQRPSRRSSGLKWFIGFFVNFMAGVDDDLSGAILLLDEPGLRLHIAQQPKLLDLFQRLASDGNRIIYSTHLSQMLIADRPRSYRLLVKDEINSGAATVVADITKLPSKSDVLQPVRQALGMGIANAIGLGGRNLIVEGWTDRLILLTTSTFCESQNLSSLKESSVSVLPAGGAGSKMLPLASMGLAESTVVVLLVDNDKAGDSTIKLLEKTFPGLVPIVRTHTLDTEKGYEIEDLFERNYYVDLVNKSHETITGFKKFTATDIDETLPVCDAIKKHFKNVGLGDFQKMLPAIELQGRLERGEIPQAADLTQFAQLFDRINSSFFSQNS